MQNFYFHFSMLIGDLIYALPGIRQIGQVYKNKPIQGQDNVFSGRTVLQLHLNQTWLMADAIMRRNGITMTPGDFDNIRPLLMAQDYIEDVITFQEGDPFHINLDEIMGKFAEDINVPYGSLPRWYFLVWPEMACDLSKRWLTAGVEDETKGLIVISRSSRCHNPNIDYRFLEKYKDQIIFIGLDDEWKSFCKVFFEVRHYKVRDFLHMASVINSAKFFMGNQSFPYALAEGLKVPRILELFSPLPNVIPMGENAFDVCYTPAAELYVERFMKKK